MNDYNERSDDAPECTECNDTGYVCDECGNADGDCVCEDGPELIACPECY